VAVLCVVMQRRLLLGILLPPFTSRRSSVLPEEPTSWLQYGLARPHMRPSRAAALVRLLCLRAGEAVLDPCGGIGVIAIEAAAHAAVCALSLDTDREACAAARNNAVSAAPRLIGRVHVLCSDALSLPLRANSLDACLADLPFGMRHARLDVGGLLRELARCMRAGGRVLLVGSAGPNGTAFASVKAAKRWPPGGWRLTSQTDCSAGGIDCTAVLFERTSIA